MITVGLVCSPYEFCRELDKSNKKYSINSTNQKLAVFTSFAEFRRLNPKDFKHKILLFDSIERLETIGGVQLVKLKSIVACVEKALEIKIHAALEIKNRNYIKELLEKNNDEAISTLHDYNTNLYNISALPVRDNVRNLFLNLIRSKIDEDTFTKKIAPLIPKKGKGAVAVQNLINLTKSDLFARMKLAMKDSQGKSNEEVKSIATKNNVAIFDLRYYTYSNK